MKKTTLLLIIISAIILLGLSGYPLPQFSFDYFTRYGKKPSELPSLLKSKEVVTEESAITKAIATALPSVVTIGISKTTTDRDFFDILIKQGNRVVSKPSPLSRS